MITADSRLPRGATFVSLGITVVALGLFALVFDAPLELAVAFFAVGGGMVLGGLLLGNRSGVQESPPGADGRSP